LLRLASYLRKQTKPIIVALNKVDLKSGRDNVERLKKEFPNHLMIPVSGDCELALREAAKHGLIDYIPGASKFVIKENIKISDKQRAALDFIQTNVLDIWGSTGVQEILDTAVFKLLGYIAIFPGGLHNLADQYGRVLPDCFLLPPKTTALQFAFHIHSDLGRLFIRAIDVKKRMVVGKDHLLNHCDVVEIVSGK
jgi:ribosome-binding ATPase